MANQSDNPYIGPRTFTQEEGELFFGRDLEARDLLSTVLSERLVVFYAQSGAGKSSLINTRLIPGLEAQDFQVLPVGRVSGEASEYATGGKLKNIFIYNLLLSLNGQLGDEAVTINPDMTLPGFMRIYNGEEVTPDGTFAKDEKYDLLPQALIIDQFEEIVTTNLEAWSHRSDFFEQLREAMRQDPSLWVVLSLREDYVAALTPYAYLMPDKLSTRFYMQRMQKEAALEAITKPAENAGRKFTASAAENLVNNLRQIRTAETSGQPSHVVGQFIEPVQLQVVCYQLWETLKDQAASEITDADLQGLAGGENLAQFVDQALAQFYEQAVVEVAGNSPGHTEFDLRDWFEDKLITKDKTRALVLQDSHTQKTEGLDNDIVTKLENRFLLRAESRAGSRWYELVHDRFVEPILQSNLDWRKDHPLIQAARDWKVSGEHESRLYQGEQLAKALEQTDAHVSLVKEFLEAGKQAEARREQELLAQEQAKTNKLLKIGLTIIGILAVAAVGFAIFAGIQWQSAQKAEAEARKQAAVAEAASQENLKLAQAAKAAEAEANIQAAAAEGTSQENLKLAATAQAAEAEARTQETEARKQRDIAESRRLASSAITNLEVDPQYSLLLAIEAISLTNTSEANDALRQAIQASPVKAILRDHVQRVNDLDFSPNGKLLATASADGKVRLWEVESGKPLGTFNHSRDVMAVTFSLGGERFATSGSDNSIRLWEVEGLLNSNPNDPYQPIKLNGHTGLIADIAFSRDEAFLVTASADGTARVWDMTGSTLITLTGHTGAINALDINQAGRQIATAGADGTARIWDAATGGLLYTLEAHEAGVNEVIFSPNGELLVTAGADGTAIVWQTGDGAQRFSLSGHTDAITSLRFNAEGTLLASGSADGTARLWDVESGEEKFVLEGHKGRINSVTFDKSGDFLATAGADGTAKVWNVADGSLKITLRGHKSNINLALFSPDGESLATASDDSTVRLWDMGVAAPQTILYGHKGSVFGMAFNPDGKLLATSSIASGSGGDDSGTVRLWNVETALKGNYQQAELAVIGDIESHIPGLAISPDGRLLAISSFEEIGPGGFSQNTVRLWNISTTLSNGDLSLIAILPIPGQATIDLAFSPDGQLLATTGFGGSMQLWDVATLIKKRGQNISPIKQTGRRNTISYDIDFSPDGHLLAAPSFTIDEGPGGASSSTIDLWQVQLPLESGSSQITRSLKYDGPVLGIDFSPNGNLLAVSSSFFDTGSGTVGLWDIAAGNDQPVILRGLGGGSFRLAFSPDDTLLATSSQDNSVTLWDISAILAQTGNDAATAVIRGHETQIFGIAFSPDGKVLATTSDDGTVILSLVRLEDLLQQACDRTRRNMTYEEWEAAFGRASYRQTCLEQPYHPSAIEAVMAQARLQTRDNQPDEALAILHQIQSYTSTLKTEADLRKVVAGFLVDQALEYNESGDFDKVTTALNQANELDQSSVLTTSVAMLQARAEARQGQVEVATRILSRINDRYPGENIEPEAAVAEMLADQARELVREGVDQVDEALAILAKAADLAPENYLVPEMIVAAELVQVGGDYQRSNPFSDLIGQMLPMLRKADELAPSLGLDPEAEVTQALVQLAQDQARNQAFDQALQTYRQALELDPALAGKVAQDLVQLAQDQAQNQAFDQALETYRQALELDPALGLVPEAEVAQAKGYQLASEGKVEEALTAYREATEADPEAGINPEAEVAQALMQLAQDQAWNQGLDEALETYRQALELDPALVSEVAQALMQLAQGQAWNQGLDETLETYRQALELDPTLVSEVAQALIQLAQNQAQNQAFDQALETYRQALELDPALDLVPEAEVAKSKARQLASEGKMEEALTAYREAVEADPEAGINPEAEVAQALVQLAQNQAQNQAFNQALETYRQALELDLALDLVPEAEVAKSKARQLALGGKVEEALRAYREATEADPEAGINPEAEVAQVLVELAQGQLNNQAFDQALETYRQALELDPALDLIPEAEVAKILIEQAEQQARGGADNIAEEKFQQALKINPTLQLVPKAEVARVHALQIVQTGELTEAITTITETMSFDPQIEDHRPAAMAELYNEVCQQGHYQDGAEKVLSFCQRAVALAVQTDEVGLNNQICQNAKIEGLTELVLPACEHAVALAIKTNDFPLNNSLCQIGHLEGFASKIAPACNRAVELALEQKDRFSSYEVCLHNSVDELAEIVAPACKRAEGLAREITFGETVRGNVEIGQRYPWRFEGKAAQLVTITMNEAYSGLDGYLILLGPDGTELIFDDESGGNHNARIDRFPLPETGTYTVVAKGYGESIGAYDLTLIEETE